MDRIDCTVIGAGVIGLAVARALALAGRDVLVIDAAQGIGTETSSRNSEVIHAGIYYPKGSLKARLCVRGRDRLYAYARERGIGHERLGKLIVATSDDQLPKLRQIRAAAEACDVHDLVLLDQAAAQKLEPELACVAALSSPSTGIIDSHALMLSFEGDAEAKGAVFAFETKVEGGRITPEGIVLRTVTGDGTAYEFLSRSVINAAGLGAQDVAGKLKGFPAQHIPPLTFARGCYFTLTGKAPFSRLIYPVPVDGGLGVHLTLDLGHQARFGPDVEWIDRIDYTLDERRGQSFYADIRRYWPALADGRLQPGYTGIRPKLSKQGEPAADFVISGPADHGIAGLVNLFGIESPGLTASLAIADEVSAKLASD
ncbi:NAD(P)/FAD-dependent oxidoreductase [Taklimakanibacter deserti]|uniref:NAD(P)/FAD-dependent oxidoreductase n=1 Tax=Taklimakanibacter deserti TaxID=2267839 RepID=UPI000E6562D6